MIAVEPPMFDVRLSRPFLLAPTCLRASVRRVFLLILIVASSRSALRMACICAEGIASTLASPMTGLSLSSVTISASSSFFHLATWAWASSAISHHLLGGAHRRLHEDGRDVLLAALQLLDDAVDDQERVLRQVLRRHLAGADGRVERAAVAGADADGVLEVPDDRGGVTGGRHRAGHLAAGTEDGTERTTDGGHERRFGHEIAHLVGELAGPALVAGKLVDLLGHDHDVRDGPRAGREFARSEHGDLGRLAAALGKLDLLVNAVLRDREVDVLEVERQFHALSELALGSRLQGLLDGREDGCLFYQAITCARSVAVRKSAASPSGLYYGQRAEERGGLKGLPAAVLPHRQQEIPGN